MAALIRHGYVILHFVSLFSFGFNIIAVGHFPAAIYFMGAA
jgi:hypothetical protein